MKLYDTSQKKLITLNKKKIKMYVCGPTVYNDVHIGNIRPAITFDVLYKYFKYLDKDIIYVSNITDIDDKIINRSINENMKELELANFYFEEYLKILNKLNIDLPTFLPKVTDNIELIITFVEQSVKKGIAYKTDRGIYFDTSKVKNYGLISGIKKEENLNAVRIKEDIYKKNPADFALWKFTEKGISWKTKHGVGRPGWHTECVVLLNSLLGEKVDIHGGGIDLRFPHHENENAQSVAYNNINLANIWMHVGHLMVDNNKMAKSLNNFITAKELLHKYNSNSIRWMFYQTGYAKEINYSHNLITEAKNNLLKLEVGINKIKSNLILNNFSIDCKKIKIISKVINHFENNLDLPNIVMEIQEIIKLSSSLIRDKDWGNLQIYLRNVTTIFEILGIKFKDRFSNDNIELLKKWYKNILEKSFTEADKLRKILENKKIL